MYFVDESAISNETFKSKETEEDPVLDVSVPKETDKVQVTASEGTQSTTLRESNSKTGLTQFCEYLFPIILI